MSKIIAYDTRSGAVLVFDDIEVEDLPYYATLNKPPSHIKLPAIYDRMDGMWWSYDPVITTDDIVNQLEKQKKAMARMLYIEAQHEKRLNNLEGK